MRSPNDEQKPKRRGRKKSSSNGGWGGYVDAPMGKSERDTFKSYLETNQVALTDGLTHMVDQGINVSVSWREDDEAYIAKASMKNPDDNKTYMLTAFHADVERALNLLIFKHVFILQEDWFAPLNEEEVEERWG